MEPAAAVTPPEAPKPPSPEQLKAIVEHLKVFSTFEKSPGIKKLYEEGRKSNFFKMFMKKRDSRRSMETILQNAINVFISNPGQGEYVALRDAVSVVKKQIEDEKKGSFYQPGSAMENIVNDLQRAISLEEEPKPKSGLDVD